jgi:hypothetical protein
MDVKPIQLIKETLEIGSIYQLLKDDAPRRRPHIWEGAGARKGLNQIITKEDEEVKVVTRKPRTTNEFKGEWESTASQTAEMQK